MIKTACIYDPPLPEHGTRVLVARYWPRGRKREQLQIAEWRREVAPSRGLLDEWYYAAEDIATAWATFSDRYRCEMRSEAAIATIADLARRSLAGETITLMCHERDGDPYCHRHILVAMIADASGDYCREHVK